MKRRRLLICLLLLIPLAAVPVVALWTDEYQSGIVWAKPPVVDPGDSRQPPSDAVVLFDGGNLRSWEGGQRWIVKEGVATAAGGSITTKQKFGDCQVHLEFATPEQVEGEGQARGNSGIYLMNRYEVQILDSYQNETYFDGQCGAIYKQQPPTVNASKKPGQWQTLDIVFTAPRFNGDGTVQTPAFITVFHNGVLIHNHFEIQGTTSYYSAPAYEKHDDKEPLLLQFHGNPIRFRNIWLRERVLPIVGTLPAAGNQESTKE